jgi:hypothetical protein
LSTRFAFHFFLTTCLVLVWSCLVAVSVAGIAPIEQAKLFRLRTQFQSCAHVYDYALGINGTYCKRSVRLLTTYTVNRESWYNVLYVMCQEGTFRRLESTSLALPSMSFAAKAPLQGSRGHGLSTFLPPLSQVETTDFPVHSPQPTLIARVSGSVAIKNPYGFLPASFYGLLPFESVRVGLFTIGVFVFAWVCWKHKVSCMVMLYCL